MTVGAVAAQIVVSDVAPKADVGLAVDRTRFLEITTLDGAAVEAVLCAPADARDAPLLLTVHGSGGSALGGVNGHLARELPERGCAVLSISTRQAGRAVNTDNFFVVRQDLEAAFAVARYLEYENIFLHGHSLGNIQVLYFAATTWSPYIRGVILTSMFANLPWKSANILSPSAEIYRGWADEARVKARRGAFAASLAEVDGLAGPLAPRMTAEHFLTYRDSAASAAIGTFWIRRVPTPILLLRNGSDPLVRANEADEMLAAALAEGSLPPSASLITFDPSESAGPAAHEFAAPSERERLVQEIGTWIGPRLAKPHAPLTGLSHGNDNDG